MSLRDRIYVLDFAGGGAVHLLGKHEFILLLVSLFMGHFFAWCVEFFCEYGQSKESLSSCPSLKIIVLQVEWLV